MIYYILKDITPLKVSVSKLLFEEQKRYNYDYDFKNSNLNHFQIRNVAKSEKSVKSSKSKKVKSKSVKASFPPKKAPRKNIYNDKKNRNKIKLIDITTKNTNANANTEANIKKEEEHVNSDRIKRRKSIFDQDIMIEKTQESLLKKNRVGTPNGNKDKKVKFKETDNDKNKNKNFDNYELNNMDYYDAIEYDKRSFLKTYWSVILREHYFIFTFFSRNDYNLFYIKIERFFILICTEITMNGMFFVHETMYKKQTGDTSFDQKIPQIIFSILVSHAIEVILCFLSMTDKHYYEIKALPQNEKNDKRIVNILDSIRRKLVGFFIFTFLLFLFHWYFISAFCAVYQNTQLIYLRDSAISILVSLIDPFIIYGFTCLLRVLSLTICCKKKCSLLYKLSDILPLF